MREISNKYVLFINETPYLLFDEYKVSHEYKEDKVMNELNLEVGKKYVARNGDIVTITEIDNDFTNKNIYPCKGDNDLYYTEHGSFLIGSGGTNDDLVKEYKEDEAMNKLQLEFGKKYVTRGGKIFTISGVDNSYKYSGILYPYKGDNELYCTEHGSFLVDCDGNNKYTDDDLIKEYKEDECMNEKNETINKKYVIECINKIINDLEEDINLINSTGGSGLSVNAIKRCINKINEVFLKLN